MKWQPLKHYTFAYSDLGEKRNQFKKIKKVNIKKEIVLANQILSKKVVAIVFTINSEQTWNLDIVSLLFILNLDFPIELSENHKCRDSRRKWSF